MEVNGKDDIPYIMENKTCSKPPTRILTCQFGWNSDRHTSVWRCCYAWINWILLRAFSGCIEHYSRLVYYLVGGFNPFEKYESQLGWLFPINGKSSSIHVPVTTNQLLYSFWFSWTNSFRIIPQQYYVLYGEKLEKSFINVGWCGILWSHWSRGYIIEAASRCYSGTFYRAGICRSKRLLGPVAMALYEKPGQCVGIHEIDSPSEINIRWIWRIDSALWDLSIVLSYSSTIPPYFTTASQL